MKYSGLNQARLKHLQDLVAPDRFSTGDSHLDLHSKDQSQHPPFKPEAVIWPLRGKYFPLDGFVKNPSAALHFIPHRSDALSVRLTPQDLRALHMNFLQSRLRIK